MKLNQKGFTLIELLVVVVIIGILVAIAIPNMLDALDRSKQRASLAELHYWGTAVTAFHAEKGAFPLPSGPVSGIYNQVVPFTITVLKKQDNWKHDFQYETDTDGETAYTLYSGGKNGALDFNCTPNAWQDYRCDLILVDGIFIAAP